MLGPGGTGVTAMATSTGPDLAPCSFIPARRHPKQVHGQGKKALTSWVKRHGEPTGAGTYSGTRKQLEEGQGFEQVGQPVQRLCGRQGRAEE